MQNLGCRVGALSHFDTLFPSRIVAAPKVASLLKRAVDEPAIRYKWAAAERALDDYLDANQVTGFLIAKGDTILVERYQYGRTDKQRFISFSMAKTVTSLLVGLALADGAIASIDDPAAKYAPGLAGTEYGRTPIRALLQMASGVSFREEYGDPNSDVYVLTRFTLGQDPGGSIAGLKNFNTRYAPPGERFSYSSAETLALGLVLTGAIKRTLSDYMAEKLWGPLGAEADASWILDATGQEVTYAYMNAVLRDWARLGLMLANGGAWNGRNIIPPEWVKASTTGGPSPGYGFQTWIDPLAKRPAFYMRGLRGQYVIVDPAAKLVLAQTALQEGSHQELFALFASLAAQLP